MYEWMQKHNAPQPEEVVGKLNDSRVYFLRCSKFPYYTWTDCDGEEFILINTVNGRVYTHTVPAYRMWYKPRGVVVECAPLREVTLITYKMWIHNKTHKTYGTGQHDILQVIL